MFNVRIHHHKCHNYSFLESIGKKCILSLKIKISTSFGIDIFSFLILLSSHMALYRLLLKFVDTQFCTHDLIKENDLNDHLCTLKS